jgi:hypothetical protein
MTEMEFSDQEWAEIFQEFRHLVISHGFASWDEAMTEALTEEEETLNPLRLLSKYCVGFMHFLKIRSSRNLSTIQTNMNEIIKTESRHKLEFLVKHPFYDQEFDLFDGTNSDEFVIELGEFLKALNGQDNGYFDEPPPEDDPNDINKFER